MDGAELYGRICVTCHGAAGDGKGLGQQLFSFGTPEDQWKNGPTLEGITKTLAGGVHGSSMKPFPDFNEEQLGALAEHVLGLREALLAAETPD